jgi:hypothetical protein
MTIPGGPYQGGQAAFVTHLDRRHFPQQHLGDLGKAVDGGPGQRRAALVIGGIQIHPGGGKCLQNFVVPPPGRDDQGGASRLVDRIGIDAGRQQPLHGVKVALRRCVE